MSPEDICDVVKLAKDFHHESSYRNIEFNEKKVRINLENAIIEDNSFLVVFDLDDRIVGGFWAVISRFYFSDEEVARDLAFFVSSNDRGRVPFPRLIQHYVRWAKSQGVSRISLSQSTGYQVERIAALYAKLGFSLEGHNYNRGI